MKIRVKKPLYNQLYFILLIFTLVLCCLLILRDTPDKNPTQILSQCLLSMKAKAVDGTVLPTIFVITPTAVRLMRIGDLTRLANTLMHVSNLLWIVVEDGASTVDAVERLLTRSGIAHAYFASPTPPDMTKNGNHQRNQALNFIRALPTVSGIVYMGNEQNSYDLRLFDDYIRNVQTVGVWAVGLAGTAYVEAPNVTKQGKVIGFNVGYLPERKFAFDFAAFSFDVNYILRHPNASFHPGCTVSMAEGCFLEQLGVTLEDLKPFGHNDYPREILVWIMIDENQGFSGDDHGYFVEK